MRWNFRTLAVLVVVAMLWDWDWSRREVWKAVMLGEEMVVREKVERGGMRNVYSSPSPSSFDEHGLEDL
jgi:hypothetical protein